MSATPEDAQAVIAFWREAGPKKWFAKDAAFDEAFRDRFAPLHDRAARGDLIHWRTTPEGALAEILLLDQYPRNAFRDTPRAFATDALALEAANAIVSAGLDKMLPEELRAFAYMPFEHSESLHDQDRAVALITPLNPEYARHAKAHHAVIARFGRFPHRNEILGRASTPEEINFLAGGGYRP